MSSFSGSPQRITKGTFIELGYYGPSSISSSYRFVIGKLTDAFATSDGTTRKYDFIFIPPTSELNSRHGIREWFNHRYDPASDRVLTTEEIVNHLLPHIDDYL